jgi:putative transcriptional regulator
MLAQSPSRRHASTMARRARPFLASAASADPGEAGYLAGQLLIAMPSLQDPRFARTIICLCSHSSKGAMGVVLNKPLDGLSFDELLTQLSLAPVPPARRITLCQGGPVEGGRGFVLHTNDWTSEASLTVTDELSLTASLDILKAIAGGGGPRRGILALGYAGWGPGQLDNEIQANAWLSVQPDEALLFDDPSDRKWFQAMAKLKVDPLLLSGAAGHA